jgi:hypothetical protein
VALQASAASRDINIQHTVLLPDVVCWHMQRAHAARACVLEVQRMHPTTDVCPVHAMHNAPQVHRARAAAMCIVQFTSFCELVRSIHIFIVFRRYAVLARRGDVFGEAVWGQLLTVDGEPAATDNNPSNNEDYTSLLPYKDTVYMVAQFESPSPSSSYFAKAKQGKDGEIEIESAEIMDWTEYGGLANPCVHNHAAYMYAIVVQGKKIWRCVLRCVSHAVAVR